MLRQLLTESSTHSMELIIIALIAVEVIIVRLVSRFNLLFLTQCKAIIRDGPELWEMIVGPKEKREKDDANFVMQG